MRIGYSASSESVKISRDRDVAKIAKLGAKQYTNFTFAHGLATFASSRSLRGD
jgi:hypothetical protein